MAGETDGAAGERQRIDKWLWHARVVRTRSLAQALVEDGHVRCNSDRVARSSQAVRSGDVLTITLAHRVLVLRVTGSAERRGSAPEAQRLYEDLSPPVPPRDPETPPATGRTAGSGRPTKRDRRRIDALSGPDEDD